VCLPLARRLPLPLTGEEGSRFLGQQLSLLADRHTDDSTGATYSLKVVRQVGFELYSIMDMCVSISFILWSLSMPVCKKCAKEFPVSKVINGKRRILNKRKFCLECSPFKRHNTLDLTKRTHALDDKLCARCGIVKDASQFYKRRNGTGLTAYCKLCHIEQTAERQRLFKQKCLEYKGGHCEICSYDRCVDALEFHHCDPSRKDFSISQAKFTTFDARVKGELDKCVLLCANCHREVHSIKRSP
jgi:hypothetical protein